MDKPRRQLVTLIVCLLALTGCSLNDTLKMAGAQQGLRDQAQAIRELAQETAATDSSRTRASLAADVSAKSLASRTGSCSARPSLRITSVLTLQ